MTPKVLVTGAAGYIGGTAVKQLVDSDLAASVHVVVRTDDQEQRVSKLGVGVLRISLTDEGAVAQAILNNDIDIVIHTASALDRSLALPLVSALGQRINKTGKPGYFIHTSGATVFADKSGWSHGTVRDTDNVFSLVRETPALYPVRQTDVAVIEHAVQNAVSAYIVVPPLVYGRGSGECNKLSLQLPSIIRAGLGNKAVRKFPENGHWQAVHVSDLASLYVSLVKSVVSGNEPPAGPDGYFFASSHSVDWWDVTTRLAAVMHSQGLITTSDVDVWPSDEFASRSLSVPQEYISIGWNSTTNPVFDKGHLVSWKPEWTKKKFLQSLDDEILAVQEAGSSARTAEDLVRSK